MVWMTCGSQLAERTGVPATTLRFYETAGLLPASRTPGGYRVYNKEAVDRVGFICAAEQLGLSLEEIAVGCPDPSGLRILIGSSPERTGSRAREIPEVHS